ncbi:MarR family winged helix-turn-helix transcriptional regulator [Streptomyces sp. NPDC059455]|uniref:MarR family winged helix-turn-helix transcriptional regulator n=1 Tax=Streptomyces sp. NPDC059455 TaxID=3346837 RepID=UPI00367ECC67
MSRPGSEAVGRVRARDDVLGYLLKHAHLALEHRAQAALAAVGVTVRDLGVLRVIASGEAQSQQEAATVLGVDRTSMVALLDALERRGIVARRPSEQDRRRNIIALTDHGREVYQQAESRYSEIERDFTAPLGDAGAAGLRQALRTVLSENGHA